jgi:predicted dehydrogenase
MIRVGVIGVSRGESFASAATEALGLKLVALCDQWEERLKKAGEKHKVATYTDYDRFLEHDMDAVVLANYFHEHAPFAVKALRAGKHVMSETSACRTVAQGVELCRTVEQTGLTYMFAENYPYTLFNLELQRLYRRGEIGRVTYAEGEYNHPIEPKGIARLAPGRNHWRNHIPSTYYCTHALAPLMHITDTMPTSVNALSIAVPEVARGTARLTDGGSVILCRMNNGSVFRLMGLIMPGHSNWYRLHGTRGAMEITRGPGYFGPQQVRVWHEEWQLKRGEVADRVYSPQWPEQGDLAKRAGHGGGDFWTSYHFANAIRTGKPPFLDVYRGVAMSVVGIQAWKSALENGVPYDMPDFHKESSRKAYENDHWSPFPCDAGPGQPPPSIRGFIKPKASDLSAARKVWKKMGYRGADF